MIKTTFQVQICGKNLDKTNERISPIDEILNLAQRVAEFIYGKGSGVSIATSTDCRFDIYTEKVKMDVTYESAPTENSILVTGSRLSCADVVLAVVKGVIRLGKFCSARKATVRLEWNAQGQVKVTNPSGQIQYFDPAIIKFYNQNLNHLSISALTEPLDLEEVDSIRICTGDDDKTAVVIGKQDRPFLRCHKGKILSENESELFLEVITAMLDGSADGWRFSEGQGGHEFTATVEDTAFLKKVKNRDFSFLYGSVIYAVVRTVQRKGERTEEQKKSRWDKLGEPTVTERSIVKVLKYYFNGQPF